MEDNYPFLRKTPWDANAFGIDTYEILAYTEESLQAIAGMPGHFTIKVDPLADKRLLHEYGFYYCDTLIEPHATREQFIFYDKEGVSLAKDVPLAELLAMVDGAFVYGRFHRDFAIDDSRADLRYANWLRQLYEQGNVWALMYHGELAGFFGYQQNKILLHALHDAYRGKGMAKYFWSQAIRRMFAEGHHELTSSISAANLAVLNLYTSLGFRFRHAVDVYHKMQR
jgi:ribosomal protein S18 acetylase RimI-like enzyme